MTRRRLAALAALVLALAGCSRDTAVPSPSATPARNTFRVDGCPVATRRFCQEASALANAVAQGRPEAVVALSRRTRVEPGGARGFAIGSAARVTVVSADEYRAMLERFVEGTDEPYQDALGDAEPRILGVSTCEGASLDDRSYHLVYTMALGDVTTERYLGTFELTLRNREWAVSVAYLAPLAAWARVLGDPLTEIGCGDVRPWGP